MSDAGLREPRPDVAAPKRRTNALGKARRRVLDGDEARAQATEILLASIADRLGLDLGGIRVHVDEEAAARTRARGARGVTASGTIWLDPGRYDPARPDGRALLAHEAAHVAQRSEIRLRPDRRTPSLAEAEREAAAVADAVREGRSAPRARATLPAGLVAADTGALAVEAGTPAPTRVQGAPARDPIADYRAWRRELDALVVQVRSAYPRQLAELTDKLDGLWVSDGDVDRALEILEPLPMEDAAALVRALGTHYRTLLVDNIAVSHRRSFPREVLASYVALSAAELRAFRPGLFGSGLFDGLSVPGLTPEGRFLAVVVLLDLPPDSQRALMTDPNRGPQFQALMAARALDPAEQLKAMVRREWALYRRFFAEQKLLEEPRTRDLLSDLQARLRDPTAADAVAALDALAALVPHAAPATTPAAPGGDRLAGATPGDRAAVVDTGSSQSPSTSAQTVDPVAGGATAAQAAPLETDSFTVIADRLERTGAIDRLIRRLPERERLTPGGRRDTFLALLRHRPADANVRLIVSLLDTGFFLFDFSITPQEARLAYDIARQLPLDARERFLRRDEGAWLERLQSSLPADVLERADFQGLAVTRQDGRLVDAGALQAQALLGGGRQALTELLGMLADPSKPGQAGRVLDRISAIPDWTVREAVVGRLDTLHKLDDFIERLPDEVLFSEDRRLDLMRLMAARDRQNLERHIHRLLTTGWFSWISSREAFLAFQMLRGLPQADRERLELTDLAVKEMSASMRASAGLHMVDARSAVTQYEQVKQRLLDERLWSAEHARELRSLVQLAVALGGRRFVFDLSKDRRAWSIPELRPMVARFDLYDERTGRVTYKAEQVQEASIWDDVGALSFIKKLGFVWIAARDVFRGLAYINPRTEQLGHRAFSLPEAQSLTGGDMGGVRFRDPAASPDSEERAAAAARQGGGQQRLVSNEASIHWDQRLGVLVVDLPVLELDSIGMVAESWSLHAGRVRASGIHIGATFQTGDFSHPRTADVTIRDLVLEDVIFGTTSSLNAASRVHLATVGVHGETGLEPPRPPTSHLLPLPYLGPIYDAVRMAVEAARMGAGRAKDQLTRGVPALRGVQLDIGAFEVEGLSLGDIDLQVSSLAVAGIHVAVGGTRTEYLRALVKALDKRIGAAQSDTERTQLRTRQEAARTELRTLEPNEAELMRLVRQGQSDPASVDPQRILALQQSGRGGVVVDTGRVTIRGVGGVVTAREVTIDRIRGQGESELVTAGVLTDEAFLRRFAQQGPAPAPERAPRDRSDVQLEAGTITAVDVAYEAAIPSTAELMRERDALVSDRPRLVAVHQDDLVARVDARIRVLAERIHDREELHGLELLGAKASSKEVTKRRVLHTKLARLFGVTISRAELTGVTVGVNLETGELTATAAGLDVHDVNSDAFGVRRVTGANVGGVAQVMPGVAGLMGLPGTIQSIAGRVTPEGGREPGARADRLRFEVVRVGQLGSPVGAIDLQGFRGSVERVPNGWRIQGLHIDTLSVPAFDWGDFKKRIRSNRPLVVSGLDADVTVTSTGAGPTAATQFDITRLEIAEISVGGATAGAPADPQAQQRQLQTQAPAADDGLIYEDFGPSRLRVQILGGALRGIWVKNVRIRATDVGMSIGRVDAPTAAAPGAGGTAGTGREVASGAGAREFDAVQFAGALGQHLSGGGVLSSPHGAREDAFRVQFASDGTTVLDLVDLALGNATITRSGSGSIKIERLGVSAHARIRTRDGVTDVDVDGIHIPSIVLGHVDWRMDDGTVITADGRTELHELRARFGVSVDDRGLGGATIHHLHVDSITAENLRYKKDPLDVHVHRPVPGAPPALQIENVEVDGLHYERGRGITAGTIGVQSAAATGEVDLRSGSPAGAGTTVFGTLRARTISVSFAPGDRLTARAQHVDADVGVAMGTTSAGLRVTDLDTGGIEVSPDRIRVGGGAQPHLRLGPTGLVHLSRLHFEEGGVRIEVDHHGRGIDLQRLDTAFTIDLNPPTAKTPIRRITIDSLDLGVLTGADFSITDTALGEIRFTAPTNQARLEGVRVRGLAVEPDSAGHWTLAGFGELHLDLLALREVDLEVKIDEILKRRPASPAAPAGPGGAAGAAATGFDPTKLVRYRDVINSLDGHINLDLVLPIWVDVPKLGWRRVDNLFQSAFWIRLNIRHGQVDIAQLEDRAFGDVMDNVVDFEINHGQLVLELDPQTLTTALGAAGGAAVGGRIFGPPGAVPGGIAGGAGGLLAGRRLKIEVAWWNITRSELTRLQPLLDYDVLPGPRLLSLFSLTQFEQPPGKSAKVKVDTAALELNNIDARLALVNDSPLPVPIDGGTVWLAPMALQGLTITGSLPGSAPLELGVKTLDVEAVDLSIAGLGRFTTGAVLLRGLSRGRLSFKGFSPEHFAGHVKTFQWSNLTLTGTPAPALSSTPGAAATAPTPPTGPQTVTP